MHAYEAGNLNFTVASENCTLTWVLGDDFVTCHMIQMKTTMKILMLIWTVTYIETKKLCTII